MQNYNADSSENNSTWNISLGQNSSENYMYGSWNTSIDHSPFGSRSLDYTVWFHSIRIIQFIIGTMANTVTCIIILKYTNLRKGSNILLFNIAISDIFTNMVAPIIFIIVCLENNYLITGWTELCHGSIYLGLAGEVIY